MIKTFKIGEYAVGGIIKVKYNAKVKENQAPYNIDFLDYYSKKVVSGYEAHSTEEMFDVLIDNTSHYWADRIVSHFNN